MKTTDFLTRTVLNGVAFETGMALSIAIAVVERGSLVKSSWGGSLQLSSSESSHIGS